MLTLRILHKLYYVRSISEFCYTTVGHCSHLNFGTSFRKIRDLILSKQASNYLLDSELSVDAIATLLNYHDSANFRRAFKRWFNMSPSAYRLKIKK